MEKKEIALKEVSRRNTESFEQTIREQNIKIQELYTKIELMEISMVGLMKRFSEVEMVALMQKAKSMGTGASVKL